MSPGLRGSVSVARPLINDEETVSDRPDHPRNVDDRVVEAFGYEWSRFGNDLLDDEELRAMFDTYTSVFPWDDLPSDAVGFDAGCGSGRWARFFAPFVGRLICVDASAEALDVARRTLLGHDNVEFRHEDLSDMGFEDGSCDFGYSLGVLHHVPDTEDATRACVRKLKPGAPFLVYLYYDLEGVGVVRRSILAMVTGLRVLIARLPRRMRHLVTDLLALVLYLPLARVARLMERTGRDPSRVPLFQYRNRSFYVMRNDALDRFGTRLEKRYSRDEVRDLLEGAGLTDVAFSEDPPWWVAVGRRSMQMDDAP
jgi:SAM-dependent methyltransferase